MGLWEKKELHAGKKRPSPSHTTTTTAFYSLIWLFVCVLETVERTFSKNWKKKKRNLGLGIQLKTTRVKSKSRTERDWDRVKIEIENRCILLEAKLFLSASWINSHIFKPSLKIIFSQKKTDDNSNCKARFSHAERIRIGRQSERCTLVEIIQHRGRRVATPNTAHTSKLPMNFRNSEEIYE